MSGKEQLKWTCKSGLLLCLICLLHSCNSPKEKVSKPQFELLQSEVTGLEFENTLIPSSEFNVFNYMYFFNGGGVSAGDFNQDGQVDFFFTSNMGSNKLFLNLGGFRFKDVTDQAGLEGMSGWTSGCSVVDINNDGKLDIYVSQLGEFLEINGRNQLYVCTEIKDGIPIFEDQARFYDLDLIGFGTQATFFDYDQDGDLDMFQLNHSVHRNGTFGQRFNFKDVHPRAGDRLFRNDSKEGEPKFTEVTSEAGIYSTTIGYGLGVATGDINLDGWPDIYVSNDFHENDYLYINQQNGTFKEVLTEQVEHTSRFSMGVDIADINNDGLPEIFTLDMVPYDPFILKSSLGEDEYGIFHFKLGYGYHPQFARNNLQLNKGDGSFQEIGLFSGVAATDWSWAPLFMDFDHDGHRDLFVCNGIPRRMNDIDYVNFRMNNDLRWKSNFNHLEDSDLDYVEKMPQIKLPNKFFHNQKNLRFEDIGNQIKNNAPSYSNGAVYADIDNDGDLDIVVNNIDDAPFVYKNLTIENQVPGNDYLAFEFSGPKDNPLAIGAKVVVFKGNDILGFENYPVRGYQSSVEPGLHIGLGDASKVDSIIVIWPDRTYKTIDHKKFNKKGNLVWENGLPEYQFRGSGKTLLEKYALKEVAREHGLEYKHKENPFVEFHREGLIPHMVSAEGPALAVGDVNGDGLEDVFFGSSKRKRSALYFQNNDGQFVKQSPAMIINDSLFEDVDALFEDIENDGDLDLVIASGGNEYKGDHEAQRQRIYLNDGKGNFYKKIYFPDAFLTASCILPADFNKDGLIDFFIGARAEVWNYGHIPKSFLFQNKGNGEFENVTATVAPELEYPGLVKKGAWTDIDKDGDQDLVLAIEWDAVQLFLNDDGAFKKSNIHDVKGWWNFVLPHDFDGDGDVDLIAGNLGENSKFRPTEKEPIRMYVNDFDDNGQVEQIVTYFLGGKEIPFANYTELTKQLVSLKKKYLYSKDLASASVQELFGKEKLTEAVYHEVNYLKSAYFENTGNLQFTKHDLPDELQFSTLNTASLTDFDNDGIEEVLLAGNFYRSNIELGWYDASSGNLLSFDQKGDMTVTGLGNVKLKKEVRRIEPIEINKNKCFIVARNNQLVQLVCPDLPEN